MAANLHVTSHMTFARDHKSRYIRRLNISAKFARDPYVVTCNLCACAQLKNDHIFQDPVFRYNVSHPRPMHPVNGATTKTRPPCNCCHPRQLSNRSRLKQITAPVFPRRLCITTVPLNLSSDSRVVRILLKIG